MNWITRWFRRAAEPNLPPHERWPEILHWQVGDEFRRTYNTNHTQWRLVALEEDGYAIVDFLGERDWVPISKLVGHNISYRTRQVNADLKNSAEYMELIKQFNIAYKELLERDRKNGIAA